MSDNRFKISNTPEPDVADMDFKQLRNKVQSLIDEMARMKRYYEDSINNLDSSNFGKSFAIQQNNMKATIKMAADVIKTAVTEDDLAQELTKYSTISQTAQQIETAVVSINNATDNKLKNYSTVEQTAEQITATVTSEYVTSLIGDDIVTNATMQSAIQQSANQIQTSVSATYETKEDADTAYNEINSKITQSADLITATVTKEYVTGLIGDEYVSNTVMNTAIEQSATSIKSEVSSTYETKTDAEQSHNTLNSKITQTANEINLTVSSNYNSLSDDIDSVYDEIDGVYDDLSSDISSVSIKANSISSRVTDVEGITSQFTQTSYGFMLDGEQTAFTGVIYLTDDAGNKRFSFFRDTSQYGQEQVIMWSCTGDTIPVVIGDTDGEVYIGYKMSGNEVATRNWVKSQGGSAIAVFG